jgi:hypothetical protein
LQYYIQGIVKMSNTLTIVTYSFLIMSQFDNFLHNINFIFCFILDFFNYRVYSITSKEKCNTLFKMVETHPVICNKYDENNEPLGVIIHKNIMPFFIIMNERIHSDHLTIVCLKSFYDSLATRVQTKDDIELDDDYIPRNSTSSDNSITYITKMGEYGFFRYGTRQVDLDEMVQHGNLEFYPRQKLLFQDIMTFYRTNHFCKIYLSGPPGCGKTYFAYLMAQKLGCYLCDVYKGNEASSNFNEIYTRTRVSSDRPIIVIFDEVDVMISEIHNNSKEHHKKYSKEIHDKISWNSFMDKIEYGMFPHVILIMTSNKARCDIDNYDKSYLRNGRINVIKGW